MREMESWEIWLIAQLLDFIERCMSEDVRNNIADATGLSEVSVGKHIRHTTERYIEVDSLEKSDVVFSCSYSYDLPFISLFPLYNIPLHRHLRGPRQRTARIPSGDALPSGPSSNILCSTTGISLPISSTISHRRSLPRSSRQSFPLAENRNGAAHRGHREQEENYCGSSFDRWILELHRVQRG